ncbi:TetR/AcrR family transcriptional regulator [Glutamicibacter uratoxydans]|uniref:TetR/AcrR family transcriptional regulator n=1 Tax=Glutamicibacter uratoxydans TaxID=43667 RepID=UPI003D6F2E73
MDLESNKKTQRSTKQGERTKQKILDATIRIASTEGHRAATVARITQETGVSPSSIYWYFKDKQALVAAAMEHSYRERRTFVPSWKLNRGQGPRVERLRANLARGGNTDIRTAFWRMGVTVAVEASPEVVSLRERFQEMRNHSYQRLYAWWADELLLSPLQGQQREQRVKLLTDLTMALLDGRYISSAIGTQITERVTAMFANGLDALAEAGEIPALGWDVTKFEVSNPNAPTSSREVLLHAATTVMARHGFHASTISRICKEAKLPPSSLYWKFKDKDALLASVVEAGNDDYAKFRELTAQRGPSLSVEDMTHALADHFYHLEMNPGSTRIGILLALQDGQTGAEGRSEYSKIRAESAAVLSQAITVQCPAGVTDPTLVKDLARLTMVVSDGLFVGSQLGENQGKLHLLAPEIIYVLTNAVHIESGVA